MSLDPLHKQLLLLEPVRGRSDASGQRAEQQVTLCVGKIESPPKVHALLGHEHAVVLRGMVDGAVEGPVAHILPGFLALSRDHRLFVKKLHSLAFICADLKIEIFISCRLPWFTISILSYKAGIKSHFQGHWNTKTWNVQDTAPPEWFFIGTQFFPARVAICMCAVPPTPIF